jgi:hypothetical protein
VYGLALDGSLLDHFLSAMRALAPCVLPCGLAVLAATMPLARRRRGGRPAAA